MTKLIWGYADVGRSGLGNMLFPWARCVLWCNRHGANMLPPRWLRLRIGPFIRREQDKRLYHTLFRRDGIAGQALRLACMITLPRHPEPNSIASPPSGRGVYVFRGMGPCFAPLLGHHEVILRHLVSIVRPAHVPQSSQRDPFAAVHVRRGDFTAPSEGGKELTSGKHNYQIPLSWYIEALRALRTTHARDLPALVFSDGREDELRALLSEPRTRLVRSGTAIAHMLTMAQARVLVASGSTFSMWGAYLGQVPTVWFPGQRRESVLAGDDGFALQPQWGGGPMPAEFLRGLRPRRSAL